MNITIICIGTRGDVQPYIALGVGLQTSGHSVRLATHRIFAEAVLHHGLQYAPVAGDPHALSIEWARRSSTKRVDSGLLFVRNVSRFLMPLFEEAVADCVLACIGTDAIIVSPVALSVGFLVGEKMGVPLVRAFYNPRVPTSYYPAFPLPRILRTRTVNRWTHQLVRQFVWLTIRTPTNHVRTSQLKLPPLSWSEPVSVLDRRRQLVLVGCSPTVTPPPPDCGEWIRFTGFWFLERLQDWQPPAGLEAFIQAGAPPVYVGFGSTASQYPEQTAALVIEALKLTGQRAVLGPGWGGLHSIPASADLFVVDDVPFDWLFPRMAAVVHHGGIGTTADGLRAGVPSVVIPLFADQPFWARKVWELGAGPRPIPRNELTVGRLADTIRVAVSDPEIRRRADALGERIRREDGVARAVEIFNEYFGVNAHSISPRPAGTIR